MDLTSFLMGRSTAEGGGGATYTAGENIAISSDNVISATDEKARQTQMPSTYFSTSYACPILMGDRSSQATEKVDKVYKDMSTYHSLYYSTGDGGALHANGIVADHGHFNSMDGYVTFTSGTPLFQNGATFNSAPQINVGTDPDTGDPVYSPAVAQEEVSEIVSEAMSTFVPNNLTYVTYKEIYPEGEEMEVNYLDDRQHTIISHLIDEGMTASEIFYAMAEEGAAGGGIKIDFIMYLIDASEGEENATAALATAPLTVSVMVDANMEPIVQELNSADFYNPYTGTWQYAHITPSYEEIGEQGIPITVELFDSYTKYQS